MKKQIFTLSFALCAAFGYAQNSNPWPTTGSVGIGTATPTSGAKLDVATTLTISSSKLAYFGSKSVTTGENSQGIFIGHKQYAIMSGQHALFQQYSSIYSVVGTANTGYIDFNAPATTNTTVSALRFGFDTSEFMRINQDGKVRIGLGTNDIKTPDGYKLFVEDGILTEKVKVAVKTTTNWADYVFAADYKLMPLNEVEKYTKENNHLPNVPSASQMVENGLDVAQMDAKLLEKVEELTLYLIEQQKQIESLKSEITVLKNNKQ